MGGLVLGRYEVKETNGPDNIILNKNTFNVDIPMTDATGDNLNYDVHIYPKNEIIRKDVELTKNGPDGLPLNGVEFKLFKETPGQVATQIGGTLTTAINGKINVSNLEQGKYYFQESSPAEGYALNNTKIYFDVIKVNGDQTPDILGQNIVIKWNDLSRFAIGGTVTNHRIPEISKTINDGLGSLNINRNEVYKYNLNVKLPADIDLYSKFEITDELDSRLSFVTDGGIIGGWEVSGIDASNLTFGNVGQKLTWTVKPDIVPGDTLGQLTSLKGKTEFTITFTSKIKPDVIKDVIPNNATLEFNNKRGDVRTLETPTVTVGTAEGAFEILKVDKADNKPLGGADFKLTTDKAGENIVQTAGTSIKVNGDPSTNPTGELIKLTTEADGRIYVTGLNTGTYYLHETKAPTYSENGVTKSYRLLTKPVEFEIDNNQIKKEIRIENSKSGWNLPTTGGMGTLLFTLVGLALMGIALITYLRHRKNIQQ